MSLALSNAPKKGALSNAPGNLGRLGGGEVVSLRLREDFGASWLDWVSVGGGAERVVKKKWVVFQRRPDAIDLVKAKADPNCRFKYKLGPKEFDGTPLTLAVKLDKPALVRKLIDFKADPASEYSMSAGRLRVHWTGPAVCGTVAKGNLAMMRLLVECEANLQGRVISFNGEPNGTLLYDAGRSDALRPVRYLLQQKGEPDLAVKFQDDMNITKTRSGPALSDVLQEVVRVLLGAQAQISGPQELRDAIDGCHVEVSWLIVGPYLQRMLAITGFVGQHVPFSIDSRGIDYLFHTNNAVLIAAAAKGLRGCQEDLASWVQAPARISFDSTVTLSDSMEEETQKCEPRKVEFMSLSDFVRFLATPDAEEILSAVFRKCELRYWQGEKRIVWKSAYILHGDMNVAVGPKKDQMDQQFHNQMRLGGD
ncbi:unnamed protein product [Durusdinium trenchii]|uniref:Uncharacterized protein n=1 Tax=Durusdinium trenchii TaxID=1381693 RepID=A0ABP0K3P9_9DINO